MLSTTISVGPPIAYCQVFGSPYPFQAASVMRDVKIGNLVDCPLDLRSVGYVQRQRRHAWGQYLEVCSECPQKLFWLPY